MLLAALGSAGNDLDALECATENLRRQHAVERLIYLSSDNMMHQVADRLEQRLGDGATQGSIWMRAVERCANAPPEEIRAFVDSEVNRRTLRSIESLSEPGGTAVELLGGRLVLFTDDIKALTQDDILSCAIVVYGSPGEPVMAHRADRWFLSPGHPSMSAGVLLLEDESTLDVTLLGPKAIPVRSQRVVGAHEGRLRVAGAAER